LNFRN